MKFSSVRSVSAASSIDAQALTADETGDGVDLQGYEEALIVAQVGTTTTTLNNTNHVTLEVEESDDGTTWNDVAAGDLVGAESPGVIKDLDADADKESVFLASYIGNKQHIRVHYNEHGTVASLPIAICVIRGRPQTAPPA